MYQLGRLSSTVLIVLSMLATGEAKSTETVRVRLFAGQVIAEAKLTDANGGRLTIYDASKAVATLDPGQKLSFDIWNEYLRARWRSGNVPLEEALVKAESGIIGVSAGDESRTYHGSIKVVLDDDVERPGLLIINKVDLPDYVTSVLPSEYGFAEPEGVKAQAVVIRTYAVRAKSRNGSLYDLSDDTGSQVYRGVSSETEEARAAVRATAGVLITYDGEPIEAVYSAHCGGHTANNEDVWNSKPIPYLRGRNDPYDEDAPVARWESRIDKKGLLSLLSRTYNVKVKNISIADRSDGGRVTRLKLDAGKKDLLVTAQNFRVAVNARFGPAAVKSTIFDLKDNGKTYRFSGKGLGHGVGLCQWGAAQQARLGKSYKDILHFYYKDVKIEAQNPEEAVAAVTESKPENVKAVHKATKGRPKKTPAHKEKSQKKQESTDRKRAHTSATSRKLTGRRVGW